jgi:acrylyl-CoA reductase (NADPH)
LVRRQQAWDRLARDLDPALLETIVEDCTLEEAVARAEGLMQGRQRGRVVVTIG